MGFAMVRRQFCICVMIALWFGLVGGHAAPALADDPDHLSKLLIRVWPEYDQPTVLVQLDGTLADASNLPRNVSVLVPASATQLIATFANPNATFAPEQKPPLNDVGDGFARISFQVQQPQYHVEYYDDLLRGMPDKSMDFAFKAAAPTDQLTIEIQQPLRSTNFSTTPASQSTVDDNGFKYHTSQYPNVVAGQTISMQVRYTKADQTPSALSSSPPVSSSGSAVPTSNNSTSVFMVVVFVVVGLAAILGLFTWQRRGYEAALAKQRGPRPQGKKQKRKMQASAPGTGFCPQCGRALGADDNYCPKCGTRRRVT